MIKKVSIVALFTMLLCSFATAQIFRPGRPDKWEFSGFSGWGTLTGADAFLTPVSDGSVNLVESDGGSGYVVGARITENLGQYFGAELEYSFSDQSVTFLNLSPQLPSFEVEQKIHNVSYNGVVYAASRNKRIRPFGTAGVGASLYQLSNYTQNLGVVSGLDLRNRWKFTFTWGGGVKVAMTRQWGFRLDFRDNVTGVPDYGLPRASELIDGVPSPAFRPDGQFHRLQFTAGFIYSFNPR